MIDANVNILKKCNLAKIISQSTSSEYQKQAVCYVNLLVNTTTGEILSLSSKVLFQEGARSVPVAILSNLPLQEPSFIRMELTDETHLPSSVEKTLKESLDSYNEFIAKNK